VEINVLQGERPMAADNKSLGRFVLDGIPPAPRGIPQIEVSFDIDASGILSVKAKDKATGKEQSIKITGSTGLSKDEVEKMTKEAEAHAAEDAKKKEEVDTKNNADALIFTAEKTLKDAGDKVSEDIKKKIEESIKSLQETIKSGDSVAIKTKTEELSTALQQVGQAMYQGQQSTGPIPGQEQADQMAKEEEEKKQKSNHKQEPVEGEVVE
jgi:molecular chaperone DnaK